MRYIAAAGTDVGNVKDTNQDSAYIRHLQTDSGEVLFAMICDGMGGLAKGELASATVVRAFSAWLDDNLEQWLNTQDWQALSEEWDEMISKLNDGISKYGKGNGYNLGTTLTLMLLAGDKYMIEHVGDSRAYAISNTGVKQLTEDHSLVAREVMLGKLAPEDAETDPRRNILLQCVGASDVVMPQCVFGDIAAGTYYVLCSDGFRHEISNNEMSESYCNAKTEKDLAIATRKLIEQCMQRGERDNITAIVIGVNE